MKKSSIQILLLIGIIASILTGIGEYLLHFLPNGPGGEIDMLDKVPLDRASKGHFFAIIGAPLYFAGYYGLKEIFKKTSVSLSNVLYILGTLAFFFGGIWISSRYIGAVLLQKNSGTTSYNYYLEQYENHYQILVWLLRIIVLSLSIVYTILIVKNKQGLPKYLAFLNPAVLLIIVLSSLLWFKPLGVHIAPIAMNVVHFIFFSILLFQFSKQTKSA